VGAFESLKRKEDGGPWPQAASSFEETKEAVKVWVLCWQKGRIRKV